MVRPDELERRLRERLDGLGPLGRNALLTVLLLPDSKRASVIGEMWNHPEARTSAELLIDCEEDRDAPGGAGRDAAGFLTARTCPSTGTKYVICRVTSSLLAL